MVVSIRTPREGRDLNRMRMNRYEQSFNPHAPRGARLASRVASRACAMFQSARPARGATQSQQHDLDCTVVSIRTPREGRDHCAIRANVQVASFNPHAPRGARRLDKMLWCRVFEGFNPHAPRGARLVSDLVLTQGYTVSIRTPREGRDGWR